MRGLPLLLWLVAASAFAGEPDVEQRAYEAPKAKKADAYELEEEKAAYDLRAIWTPADAVALEHARLALTFGRYDVARDIALPLADKAPDRADVQTVAGLAWMGTYYEKYGLSEAAFARLQGMWAGAEARPSTTAGTYEGRKIAAGAEDDLTKDLQAGAMKVQAGYGGSTGLSPEEVGSALARGFVLAPGASTRGGQGVTPEPLVRAQAAFDTAYALDPNDGAALLHAFVAEVERSRWEPRSGELAARRKQVEKRISDLPVDQQALAWVDLGVDAYVARKDPAAAVAAFEKAAALGSPLGAYDRALVLAFDPKLSARNAEGVAALRALAADPTMSADRVAASAGRLPTPTGWPFGAPPVEWATSSRDVAELVAVIEGHDPAGALRTDLGDVDEVQLASGLRAVVKEGYGAWVVVPTAHVDAPPVAQAVAVATGDATLAVEGAETVATLSEVRTVETVAVAPKEVRRQVTRGGDKSAAIGTSAPAMESPPVEPAATTPGRYAAVTVPVAPGPRARTAPVLTAPRETVTVRVQEVCGVEQAGDCPVWMEVRLTE